MGALKKIFGGIAVLAIAAVAAWNVGMNSQQSKLLDTMLANVEALAAGESGTSASSITCYNTYNSCCFWDYSHIWRCSGSDCYDVSCDGKSDQGTCSVKTLII